MPSLVDAKSLRDLEVMKSCHDITSVITEESLRSIQECYSIPEEYALWAPFPPEVEEIRMEAMPKRPAGSAAPEQATTARPKNQVKITVKKHKSHHGKGSS
ncbi:hypothetical protein BHM03_00011085 [Ensete ventricosum]|nr:hypothetical protein BHM03_00011085 [Ensete ventricosum]